MNAPPRRTRRGWSWPRTLAVATLAVFGALIGTIAVPFLFVVLLDLPTGLAGAVGGWWLGLGFGTWLGLRVTR